MGELCRETEHNRRMPAWTRTWGLLRSLALYHGIPWRAAQLRRFYAPVVPAGGLAFDVGAHAGNRVRAFRALGARVVAVEPQPDFAALLSRWFARDVGVTVLPMALGREAGQAQLLLSEATPTVSTLSAHWAQRTGATASFQGVRWSPGPVVPVTTLDALIAQHGRPDFIKIDVEGFELEVLQGLGQPVPALSFEFLAPVRDLALGCIDRLEALGRYRYQWSVGEQLRLQPERALDADAMRAWLRGLADDAPSGDILARLHDEAGAQAGPRARPCH
jgi:FkbM family methyltransferase